MKPTIIYDGQCKFCSRFISRLQKNYSNQFDFVSSHSSNVKKYSVSKTQAQQGIIFINENKVLFHKAEAVEQIYRRISKVHFFSWARRVPLLKQLVDIGYKLVAKHRYKVFGRCEGVCEQKNAK